MGEGKLVDLRKAWWFDSRESCVDWNVCPHPVNTERHLKHEEYQRKGRPEGFEEYQRRGRPEGFEEYSLVKREALTSTEPFVGSVLLLKSLKIASGRSAKADNALISQQSPRPPCRVEINVELSNGKSQWVLRDTLSSKHAGKPTCPTSSTEIAWLKSLDRGCWNVTEFVKQLPGILPSYYLSHFGHLQMQCASHLSDKGVLVFHVYYLER